MEFSKYLIGIPVAVIVAVGTKKQRIVEPRRSRRYTTNAVKQGYDWRQN